MTTELRGLVSELLMRWPLYVNDSGVVSCRAACCSEEPWTPADVGRRTDLQGLVDSLAVHMAESIANRLVGEP